MKTIIITGAGSGMGRSSAIKLASNEDVKLVLVGRRSENLEETLALLNDSKHQIFPVDITNQAAFSQGLAKLNLNNVVGLFANAGIGGENTYGEGDRWDDILNINLTGTYISIMETLPYIRQSEEKVRNILMTSSCLARFGVPNYTAYCTSKAGLLGLCKSLAVELAQERILVNALCPGWVETEMAQAGISLLADRQGKPYEETYKEQMSYVPTGRMSDPEEIADWVNFIFCGNHFSMTGQGIDINNGSFMI